MRRGIILGIFHAGFRAGLLLLLCSPVLAAPLAIVHTNDLHSHLLGFGPELDFSPATVGDDETVGGLARIATVIQQVRETRGERVFVLDAGDFLMGSLFHTVSREEAGELRLLGSLGYDGVTLGNHEFDLKPQGLAAILRAAKARGPAPPILAANVLFDPQDPADDELEKAFQEYGVQPYRMVQRGGLRVGIFGLMGKRAAEVAPFARPVKFRDIQETARDVVRLLREKEKADLVICLSHSGLSEAGKGEDAELARKVPGIDVIVSGHTHTLLREPLRVGSTWIVQAGSYGRHVGILELEVNGGGNRMSSYRLVAVDDRIPGDPEIQARVDALKDLVEERFLRTRGLAFAKPVAKVSFPLTEKPWGESTLGNLASDAVRWSIDRAEHRQEDPMSRTRVAVVSNGVLRDPLLPGKQGILAVSDLFRVLPLGFGPDGEMGYPLLGMYFTGAEIRKALEVLTSVAPLKGTDYVIQLSGVRFAYNPNRVPFDRVTDVWIQDAGGGYTPLDTSSGNPTLYKVGANLYNATFLKIIGRFTYNILDIVPKDRTGRPIAELTQALVDRDPAAPGVQELKEWEALVAFVGQFPDRDGDGLPEIPDSYKSVQGRILSQPTWNPFQWFRGARGVTFAALGAVLLVLGLLMLLGWGCARVMRKRP
jgi:5'-nucleotidase